METWLYNSNNVSLDGMKFFKNSFVYTVFSGI